MAEQYSNQAKTTLASGIDESTNTVVLTDASKFPSTGLFTIVCEDELMLVVSRSGSTLTVERGSESTTAAPHVAGQNVAHVLSKRSMAALLRQATMPNGFPFPSEVTLTWSDATRTLTVSPTGTTFTVVCGGVVYNRVSGGSVQIANTTGNWIVYYDNDCVLTASQTSWDFLSHAIVASIYWDATNAKATTVGYELGHGTCETGQPMDDYTHLFLHNAVGACYRSGLALGRNAIAGGTPNTDNRNTQISVQAGEILDEDIRIIITNGTGGSRWEQDLGTYPFPATAPAAANVAKLPVLYKIGPDATSYWVKAAATNWPFPFTGGNLPQWNQNNGGTWQLTQMSNNNAFVVWIMACNDITHPVVSIIGEGDYADVPTAAAAATPSTLFTTRKDAPGAEFRLLYRLIYYVNTGWTASTKFCALRQVDDYRNLTRPWV